MLMQQNKLIQNADARELKNKKIENLRLTLMFAGVWVDVEIVHFLRRIKVIGSAPHQLLVCGHTPCSFEFSCSLNFNHKAQRREKAKYGSIYLTVFRKNAHFS
jgi:hypothetical protein